MSELLFWLYITNTSLLIMHEIDSAYWKEWNLFKFSGKPAEPSDDIKGLTGFLVFHVPMVFVLLYGVVKVCQATFFGLVMSLVVAASGLFAFVIHMIFLKKGRPEFRVPASLAILWTLLPVSICQMVVTILLFLR